MTKAMAGMMEMARRMGGDPMKGMARMMEMMGSTGGMMGGGAAAPGAVPTPSQPHPH